MIQELLRKIVHEENADKPITVGLIGRQGAGKDYFTSQLQDLLKEHFNVILIRMADPIKQASAAIFGSRVAELAYPDYASFERVAKESLVDIPSEHFFLTLEEEIAKLMAIGKQGGITHITTDEVYLKATQIFGTLALWNDETDSEFVQISPRLFQQILGTEVFRQCVDFDFWCIIAKELMKVQIENGNLTVYICPDIRFENEAALFDNLIYIDRTDKDDLSPVDMETLHASEQLCEKVRNHFLAAIEKQRESGGFIDCGHYPPLGIKPFLIYTNTPTKPFLTDTDTL